MPVMVVSYFPADAEDFRGHVQSLVPLLKRPGRQDGEMSCLLPPEGHVPIELSRDPRFKRERSIASVTTRKLAILSAGGLWARMAASTDLVDRAAEPLCRS